MACAVPAVTLRPAGERTPSYPQEYEQMSEQDDWDREREERLRMIRDSAASLVPRDGDLTRVRRGRFSGTAVDRQAWREVCAMGWPGLR
ncbi:hypothetical protein K3Z80_26335, partial [Pseudomonas aeruginosa]|nr:hypothetical protein [Pseudomonas aeruginosa]